MEVRYPGSATKRWDTVRSKDLAALSLPRQVGFQVENLREGIYELRSLAARIRNLSVAALKRGCGRIQVVVTEWADENGF